MADPAADFRSLSEWHDAVLQITRDVRYLDVTEAREAAAFIRARAAYRDNTGPPRACDHCGKEYRGPAVFCCHACATAAA